MAKDTIRRLAASILNVGKSRVWIDNTQLKKVSEAITREDVKGLIKEGIIKKLPPKSRFKQRIKEEKEQKRKGRKRGPGSRKGTKKTRIKQKQNWMNKIRAQRKLLKKLLKEGKIQKQPLIKKIYLKIKGNQFKSKRTLLNYLKENNLLIKWVSDFYG